MTSTVEAPRLLAEALGEPVSVIEAVARSLRGGLYPVSSKGGGRGLRHLGPEHLTALLFGVALHGITRASAADLPRLVASYLRLGVNTRLNRTPHQPVDGTPSDHLVVLLDEWRKHVRAENQLAAPFPPPASELVPYATAGDAFAGLLDWLSRPEGVPLRGALRATGADLELGVDVLPDVTLRFFRSDHTHLMVHFDQLSRGMFVGERPLAALRRSAWIRFRLIEVLVDACADTQVKTGGAAMPELG